MTSRSLLLALALAVPAQAATEPTAAGLALFQTKVRQILTRRCFECHGGAKVKGEYNISTREGLLKGGKHGPGPTPFDAAHSKFMLQVQKLAKPNMPPKGEWLTVDEIRALHRWIDEGAPYDGPLVWPGK